MEKFKKYQNRVKQYWNSNSKRELGREEFDPKKTVHTELLWREIKRRIGSRKKLQILDAGGGPGRFAIPLAEMGHQVTLLDLSQEMLDLAKQRTFGKILPNLKYIRDDLSDPLRFADNQFDLVLCLDSPLSFCAYTYKEALQSLVRVSKDEIVICAMNRHGVVLEDAGGFDIHHYGELRTLKQVLSTGTLDVTPEMQALEPRMMPGWHAFTSTELCNLLKKEGCTILHVSAPGTFVRSMELELLQKIQASPAAYADFLDFEEEFDQQPDVLGIGSKNAGGLLVSGKKP